jgi:hypothetical protein
MVIGRFVLGRITCDIVDIGRGEGTHGPWLYLSTFFRLNLTEIYRFTITKIEINKKLHKFWKPITFT